MRRVLGLGLLAVVAAACYRPVELPSYLREPEVVGRIEARELVADDAPEKATQRLTLASGELVEVDLNAIHNLRPGTDPDPEEILIYGHDPDGEPWFWSGDECALPSRALDEGETIAFEFGLRLPKADDFDPGWIRDGEFSDPLNSLCINEKGEVTDLRG